MEYLPLPGTVPVRWDYTSPVLPWMPPICRYGVFAGPDIRDPATLSAPAPIRYASLLEQSDAEGFAVDGLRMAKYRMVFSSAKAEQELGYRARPYGEGLAEAIEWFRKAGKIT